MDMTKDALQYLANMKTAQAIDINGEKYTDKPVYRVDKELRCEAISMGTLTGLVDYIKSGIDCLDHMIIQVISPTEVHLISPLDSDRKREVVVTVNANIPEFNYGYYMATENFIIALQSKFKDNNDRALLLRFAGTVKNESVAQYGDDGVSQKATIKTGISSVGDAVVPNPVKLRPFRTFLEVEQPESAFVFRMKQDEREGVKCAIFEADGGAWKNAAMKSIKECLQFELADLPQFTVIS